MNSRALQVSGDPGDVWRVGHAPDPWQWTDWRFASDVGRFNGRWDDERAEFRSLYTCETLLGCFLELLAQQRPNDLAYQELEKIEDDDHAVPAYPDPERGAIGRGWLSGRLYGHGVQTGRYAEITHAETIAYLVQVGVFEQLGIPARDVDAALLKDARQRHVTRSIARFLYDQQDASLRPVVHGIAFRSRMGDDIRLWAVFERADQRISEHTAPDEHSHQVTEDHPDLQRAFELLSLHWRISSR